MKKYPALCIVSFFFTFAANAQSDSSFKAKTASVFSKISLAAVGRFIAVA